MLSLERDGWWIGQGRRFFRETEQAKIKNNIPQVSQI
jgi:hypothetical protein